MGRGEMYTGFWWGNLRERDQLEDPGVDVRIILRWIFSQWTGVIWVRIGTLAGTCECGNGPLCSIPSCYSTLRHTLCMNIGCRYYQMVLEVKSLLYKQDQDEVLTIAFTGGPPSERALGEF